MHLSVINKSNKELFNQITKTTYGKLVIEKKLPYIFKEKIKKKSIDVRACSILASV